jgi:hypothetical protein
VLFVHCDLRPAQGVHVSTEKIYDVFYRIARIGASELSDGGGPLGFDITTALEFDYIIQRYQCDAIIETGSNCGDSTEYFARVYPHMSIITCDVVDKYVEITRRRVGHLPHCTVLKADSPDVIAKYADVFRCPLFFLDAHWYEPWPLERELSLIKRGIVCVDDFDIGHPRFGYDEYQGVKCDAHLLTPFRDKYPVHYTNNPDVLHELPCLQVGRRGGKAYLLADQSVDYLQHHRYFRQHLTPAAQ